eukprot:755442-Hanusia_phi.AAC.4
MADEEETTNSDQPGSTRTNNPDDNRSGSWKFSAHLLLSSPSRIPSAVYTELGCCRELVTRADRRDSERRSSGCSSMTSGVDRCG